MDTPLCRDAFLGLVAEAYEHLYDLVYLRSHPLTTAFINNPALDPKERAWRLQQLLLGAVNDLYPGPHAPALSSEMRRYKLASLFYVEGLDPQVVADRLGISRRHFYRERQAAVEAIAQILWERYRCHVAAGSEVVPLTKDSVDRLEMLRLEAARLAQASRYADLSDVLGGALVLLHDRLAQHAIATSVALASPTMLSLSPGLLRQVLLTVLSFLIERSDHACLRIEASPRGEHVQLTVTVDPVQALRSESSSELHQCLRSWQDLVQLARTTVQPIGQEGSLAGFILQLPLTQHRTVLVVDDNEDVLELFSRYLTAHGYRVLTATSADEALTAAAQSRPYAITLDIMMPDKDGWDILQALMNQPESEGIPIIVCSVLQARELAISLGAAAFLEKPVTEQALVATLQALGRS